MFAVIRLRTKIGLDRRVLDTMEMLGLKSANRCVLLPDTPNIKGMLRKTKDYVTWGEISKETLVKMVEKRLRTRGGQKIDKKDLKEISGFDSYEALASAIMEGKAKMHKQEKIQVGFRLTPPSKGFRSVTRTYPKGDLGYRGKEINGLIERMI